MTALLIETQHGLGDNIYHRAFVKTLSERYEVYLRTPFMEVYDDLDVSFVKPTSILRTQAKSIARSSKIYYTPPANIPKIIPKYNSEHLRRMGIVDSLAVGYRCDPSTFDLPKYSSGITSDKPICVVRPATLRKEWLASGRNPNPEYIAKVVEWLRETHYIISVADLEEGAEIALNPLPYADLTLHEGQLTTEQLLGLIREADIVVGGVGFIVPACISYNTKLFCILGGTGGYNAPSRLLHKTMDVSRVYFAQPDNYCLCTSMQHQCDKRITDLKGHYERFIKQV